MDNRRQIDNATITPYSRSALRHDKPIPVVALTTSMAKSGEYPVRPNTVVLRYLWWPQRSMNDINLVEFSQISSTVLESL